MFYTIALIGFGLFFFIAGFSQLRDYLAFRRRSVRVRGLVVDLVGGAGASGKTDYYPVLEFTTQDGEHIRATSSLGCNPPMARPGQARKVAYDPQDPSQAEVSRNSWLSLFFAFLMPTLGGITLAFGLLRVAFSLF